MDQSSTAPCGPVVWTSLVYSRGPILQRMQKAVPGMTFVTTPFQPVPGLQELAFPSFKEHGAEVAQQIIDKMVTAYGIDCIWVYGQAKFDLSKIRGCPVHRAATPDVIELLDDKAAFTKWLGKKDSAVAKTIEAVGPWRIWRAYRHLRRMGLEACAKPSKGVNGWGYWHFSDSAEDSHLFSDPNRRRISIRTFLWDLLWDKQRRKTPLVVMEVLPGLEVSIDALCNEGDLLAYAARTKIEEDIQVVSSEHPMIEHARQLIKRLRLHGIISIQYRQDRHGNWKILEINARPAGGCTHSEDAGFRILTYWAQLIAGVIKPGDVEQVRGEVTLDFRRVAFPRAS